MTTTSEVLESEDYHEGLFHVQWNSFTPETTHLVEMLLKVNLVSASSLRYFVAQCSSLGGTEGESVVMATCCIALGAHTLITSSTLNMCYWQHALCPTSRCTAPQQQQTL
jgi:hypothetical protein